jgi:hypothetical protein
MNRAIAPFALVLGISFTGAAIAQDSTVKTETKIKGDDAQTVTYTGCVQTGAQTSTYVLDKVVPVGHSTETSTSASGVPMTTTSTTYALVPGDTVQITEYVGHKVEVTGMLVPKGEMKTETETRVGDDTTKKEKVETESDVPQFRVISIKNLAERCE